VEILDAVIKFVLTVLALITAGIEKEPPPPDKLINSEPSPINLARIVAAEIVVKNPKLVDIEFVDILDAVIKFVLTVLALITAGIEKAPPPPGKLLNDDPSPTNLAKIVPAEIVEKKPKLVEVVIADVFETVKRKFTLLLTVVKLVVFETPTLLTLVRLLLTVANATVSARLLNDDPSPTKRPKIAPAEIVEKNP